MFVQEIDDLLRNVLACILAAIGQVGGRSMTPAPVIFAYSGEVGHWRFTPAYTYSCFSACLPIVVRQVGG
jgi:hypothetical protein